MDSIFQNSVDHAVEDDRHHVATGTRQDRPAARERLLPFFAECGAGWYHDEAIADAREAHAHPYG